MKSSIKIRPKFLILISLSLGLILLLITVFDIYQSQQDIYKTKQEEAISLIRAVQKAGENVYISSQEVENLIYERIIDNALFVSRIEKKHLEGLI